MVDSQSNAPDPLQPAPLSLKAFAASLYHAERADNYFQFLHNLSDRPDAELLKPARTLITSHLMGRPLGLPHRREQQMAVIRAALRLLETAEHAPTIQTFPS